MQTRKLFILFGIFTLWAIHGCATTPPPGNMRLIPLQEVNVRAIFEENEGLEVTRENAKELRDFYRGGVQQKAKAEKKFAEKKYPAAMQLYLFSNELFCTVLEHIEDDSAQYSLFEGTDILFFPTLLMADNHLKMGRINDAMGRKWSARRNWRQALSLAKRSLATERTEWGLSLQQEILLLLTPKKDRAN